MARMIEQYGIHHASLFPGLDGVAEYMKQPFDETAFRKQFKEQQMNPKGVLAGRWCVNEGYTDKGAGSEDAASLALFLASDDSAGMTGQDINCSGGVMW